MKATDLWTLFCYLGVFYSLTEYCIVLYLTKRSDWEMDLKSSQQNDDNKLFQKPLGSTQRILQQQENQHIKLLKLAGKFEFTSRIFVPIYFVTFVLLYWIICLSWKNTNIFSCISRFKIFKWKCSIIQGFFRVQDTNKIGRKFKCNGNCKGKYMHFAWIQIARSSNALPNNYLRRICIELENYWIQAKYVFQFEIHLITIVLSNCQPWSDMTIQGPLKADVCAQKLYSPTCSWSWLTANPMVSLIPFDIIQFVP